jgi:outer membrane beta-barrel protein
MTLRRTAAALVLAAAALAAAPAWAQSSADAFAGKIPPVSGQLYRKAGKLELTLTGNVSLDDAFFTKYFGGVKAGYHLNEYFSISAMAAAGTNRPTNSTVLCPANTGCRDATDTQLYQVPGELTSMYGLELAWSPVYGKLNAFSEQVVHFDLSLLVGADMIGYREVISSAAAAELEATGGEPATKSTFGGHLGIGIRAFITPWMALRLEVKDYLYAVEVPNGGTGQKLQSQLFTELGASFFVPLSRSR